MQMMRKQVIDTADIIASFMYFGVVGLGSVERSQSLYFITSR